MNVGMPSVVKAGLAALLVTASAAAEVEFERDVKPILEARCWECHSEIERNGGLRLDRRSYAFMGGDSGVSALAPGLDENPIWQRVTSEDAEKRMPFDGDPLPAEELAVLKAWVEAGLEWPAELETEAVFDFANQVSKHEAAKQFKLRFYSTKSWFVTHYVTPKAPWLTLALIALLVVGRFRSANRAEKAWAQGRFGAWAGRLSAAAIFAGFLAVLCVGLAVLMVQIAVDYHAEWSDRYVAVRYEQLYGDPPIPLRPGHGRRVAGTYWRGNCERSPKLFNGGYYCTAILHLDLCDESGDSLDYGDPLPETVYARLVIERAPNASAALFSDTMLKQVIMTTHGSRKRPDEPEDATRFEVVHEGREWTGRYPLQVPGRGESEQLLVYVIASGSVHYGIDATLAVDEEGKLASQSDVWLGTLYWNGSLAKPERGKVPLNQWFDHAPMPLIERTNSTDPTLVGSDQYLPDGQPPAEGDDPK